jgi:hypothetical protein
MLLSVFGISAQVSNIEQCQQQHDVCAVPVHDAWVQVPECCSYVQANGEGVTQRQSSAVVLPVVQDHLQYT